MARTLPRCRRPRINGLTGSQQEQESLRPGLRSGAASYPGGLADPPWDATPQA